MSVERIDHIYVEDSWTGRCIQCDDECENHVIQSAIILYHSPEAGL